MSWAQRWAAETGAGWAVTRYGELVGRVGFQPVNLADGSAEAGFGSCHLPAADVSPHAPWPLSVNGCSPTSVCTDLSCSIRPPIPIPAASRRRPAIATRAPNGGRLSTWTDGMTCTCVPDLPATRSSTADEVELTPQHTGLYSPSLPNG
jgi:hypothetical protein